MEKQEMKNNGGEKGNEPTGWENMDVPQVPAAIDVTKEIGYVNTLDEARSVLLKTSQEKGGIPVSMKFNDHIIRSDMSEDEMYLEVTGKTKQDHEKAIQELIAQQLAEFRQEQGQGQAPAAIDVTKEIGRHAITLDEARSVLLKTSQEKGGIPVSMKFKDHIIRSDMSEDEMYLEVTGKTKQDHEKAKQEWIAQQLEKTIK